MNIFLKISYFVFFFSTCKSFELDFSSSDILTLNISNSPYEFNKTVVIPLGKILVIDPGVELRMGPSISMIVKGTLIANGTKEKRIKFKPLEDSHYFDAFFSSQFVNLNLKGGFCVENGNKRTNKEVASAICREMGFIGESYLFNYMNSSFFSTPSNPLLSVSKCNIKSPFLDDNCELNFVWHCSNGFRSVYCSQPSIHNYWSGLFFFIDTTNQANKSILVHVDFEKGGLNKTCCSKSKMNHALINIQDFQLVILKYVKISDSASNGISIQNMNINKTTSNFTLNGIQISNIFLSAIEISNKNISSFELYNSEIKAARTGVLVDTFKGELNMLNISFENVKSGIKINNQLVNQLNVTLKNIGFFLNEIALDDESKSRLVIDNVKIYDTIDFGIKKSKGFLYVSSTQFRSNNVSVFLLNSDDIYALISGNNFSQDIKHAVFYSDTHQDSSFTLELIENRFELSQFQTVQLTLKLTKKSSQSQSNVLIEANTFTQNVGLSVLELRFVYDFDSLTNHPNRLQVTNNEFLDNEIYTYGDSSVNIKKHGVLAVSLGYSILKEPYITNSNGYQWQQMLRNLLIENNTFANPKSTFEVATFYTNFTISYEHLVKLDISYNHWLSYSNELEILSRINAYHLNKNLSIAVNIYPLYLNGYLNKFSPSGSIVASGNQLGFYVNKDYVLESGVYKCPYGMMIEQGSSLTLKPNVTIEFQLNTKILVLGKLNLKGELNKKVHLKFTGSKSNQTNDSSSSFNYEKRLRISPINSNIFQSQGNKNYKIVEVFIDSKWQPICYNWEGKWIYDYIQGWIYIGPPLKSYLTLICKWMGLGDCEARGIRVRLNVDISKLYNSYVNEFDFDPNFHSNLSEVKISSCKSNCVCQLFLSILPVNSLNSNLQSVAVHFTTYGKASLITNVLASNFPFTVFRIDNQKHLIENVQFENNNQKSLNAFIIQKQDPLNMNQVIGNIKSTHNSLGSVNITLLHNDMTFAGIANISITNRIEANLEVLNTEFSAYDLHVNECEPRVHLKNEQITLMKLNSVNNLSCLINLSASFGRRLVVTLIGVERTLCSTNLTVSNSISGSELLFLRTGSIGKFRSFFVYEANLLSIQLAFSSACSELNQLKLKFESIDSAISVSALTNTDSVKIVNSNNLTLINKISRNTPNAYPSDHNKKMRVENTSIWNWQIDDAFTLNNLQLKDIYYLFVNNVTFSRFITSDLYTLSDIKILNSNYKNVSIFPLKINIYKISIWNSEFGKSEKSNIGGNLVIQANYLNLSSNIFTKTGIRLLTSCFEIRNNQFLKIDANILMDLHRDQDLLKHNRTPQLKCNQLIDSNLFIDNIFYIYITSRSYTKQVELNFFFRNNFMSSLKDRHPYLFIFRTSGYNSQIRSNDFINIELVDNFFADSHFNKLISTTMVIELTVKFINNTFSNMGGYLTLLDCPTLIQQLQFKSNKFVNSSLNYMRLYVDKHFEMELNEFTDNTLFKSMLTLHVMDLSTSLSSKAILRNNTFIRNKILLNSDDGCATPMIEIVCVRLDDIFIGDNIFDNQFQYPSNPSITELIIKFTDSKLNANWFANDFLIDLSSNSWGENRTESQLETVVYVINVEYDSLFKAKLTESITSSIGKKSCSKSCSPIGGFLPSGETLRLTKANSPYFIHSTWIIGSKARVEVEPGVDIIMAQGIKVIIYGSLVMNGTSSEKIRFNPNSVDCIFICESKKICPIYTHYSFNMIRYILFRSKKVEEQSILRHVELNNIALFVDGFMPLIEQLVIENNRSSYYSSSSIIIFKSVNDIQLNSVIARETYYSTKSVLIYEQQKNIHIESGIFNRAIHITNEIEKLIAPFLLESVNWGREYWLEADVDFYLNLHLNLEGNDCLKRFFFLVKAKTNQIISVWSETNIKLLSSIGFKFLNSNNQTIVSTNEHTQLTSQNYLRIELFLTSCTRYYPIILRFQSLESIFSLNDFSEPKKSLLFPTSLFSLNDSVSNWFVTNNRLAFRFFQSSVANHSKLDILQTVILSSSQRICGLSFERGLNHYKNNDDTLAIYLSTAQGDNVQIFKEYIHKPYYNQRYQISNVSLFRQFDTFRFKFEVTRSGNVQFYLRNLYVTKCHFPHNDSVNITLNSSYLYRVIVENFEFTPYSYNVELDRNVFFNKKYYSSWAENKSPIHINVGHLKKFKLSNSMIFYCNSRYFTHIKLDSRYKIYNQMTIGNENILVEINSNFIWRNRFRGFVQIHADYDYYSSIKFVDFKTIISNNFIKNNTFTDKMISYRCRNFYRDRNSKATIKITSNFITLNDGSSISLQEWSSNTPVAKINRNAFFFNNRFRIETTIRTLIEENAFLRNVALIDLYYIVYYLEALDVPSKIGNWWNTLDIRELANRVRNYNASRLLADIPISLSKYNLKNSYCDRGWTELNAKCYFELPVQLTYTNAVQACANLSSYLANFDQNSLDQFKRLRNSSSNEENEHFWLPVDLDNTLCKTIQTLNGSIDNKTSCFGFNHVVCEQEQTCSNLQCNQTNAICQASKCICWEGWHGPSCNEFNCIRMNNCSNRGTCSAPNRCACDENWRGRSCSSHFCFLFSHCGSCTSQLGCGWCDQTKRCLPATRNDRQPESEFKCSAWFFYNCLTPSNSQCSNGIVRKPACESTYCEVNSIDFNKVSCQQCRDSDTCYSSATKCRAWNETKCPYGLTKPDYSDANRFLFAEKNPNVLIVDTNSSVVMYKCPINTASRNIELLLFKSEQLADLIQLDSIIQSEQAKGIFHKVKLVQRLGDYRFIFAHLANLQELYTYADFEMPVKKMFVLSENDNLFEPVQENLSTDLIARVRTSWNSSQSFDIATTTHFMCQGNKYESIENITFTQGFTLFLLVKKTSLTLQFSESDLIYSNNSDLTRYLETVDSIEVQSDSEYSEKVFVKTHLTDCSNELSEATLTNLLNLSVGSSDLDCFGGQNMNESLYVFDNEDMDKQQHKLLKPNDVVQGRSGTNSFVLQILKKSVFNDFLLFECKQIESLPYVNKLVYYERVYQIVNTQERRIEGETSAKVLVPKLGASVTFGKVSLKSDINMDADVNLNFKPFSIGFGMTINYDIVVSVGTVGVSYEFSNKPILWRFFVPAPPPFVRIPAEFSISGVPEVSIDVDTNMQTQVQFRGSKKFYKEFKLNDDSDSTLVDQNPTLTQPPLNGNTFTNAKIEAKYTLQLKLGIPSYRILVKQPTKYPDWLQIWKLDITVFEFNVYFALPFSFRLEIDTCYYKCYDENEEKAMALKVAYGNLGCEAGAGLMSFKASVQTKFNLCGDGASLLDQHWCYPSITKPTEKCPCKCDDGTVSERDEDGECKCDCTCDDGTKDTLDKNGHCPCKCKCKNCKESVKKSNGCFCPHDNQKCSKSGVVGQWVKCKFECVEKWPCGSPPYCSAMRRGANCKRPHCPRGCVNGNCVASGRCGAICRCFIGWQGIRCDQVRIWGWGDPWFITFNGFSYGFQGLGDYWYCMDTNNDMGIQIRTYLFGGLNTYVSSISGVAVKLSNSVFTVFLNESMIYVLRLNNKIIANKNDKIVLNNSLNGMEEIINIDFERNFIAIDRKDHSSITIYMNKRNIDLNVNLKTLMNTKGLCGAASKFVDDFKGPDGTQYFHSWLFGKSWKLNNTNTLNLMTWSWNSSNFHLADLKNNLYDENYLIVEDGYHTVLSPQSRMANPLEKLLVQRDDSQPRKLCEQNELKGDMLTFCILDILATGDESFGQTELYKTELCPNNCNGHGTCLSKGVCNCTEGWTGANCQIGQCQYDCVPNGKCTSGFCECRDGWDGVDCKTKASCDLVANCTDENHGICVKNNVCKCFAGFGGDNCDQISLCLPLKKCNGNGYCASEKCTCNSGWTSADCAQPSCESRNFCSTHGICVGFDFCQCDEFYTGDSCSIPQCPHVNECSSNGRCIAPNTCSCYPGFKEPDCLQRVECLQLNNCNENGVCVQNATECICYGGYEGDQCEIVQCDQVNNCSVHGTCVEPNLCECDFGYKGTFCNETTCESLNFCSYNGLCNERQECDCTIGWSGQDCSVAECSQVNFCSGNGVCNEPNICQCLQNFDGISCDMLIGENLFAPSFSLDTYETRLNELATIGTFIVKVKATDEDKNSTRNSMVKYSIQTLGDFYDYFKINEINGSIYLRKSLLLLNTPALLINIKAYDQGTPRKFGTAQVKINLDRSISCDDILNPVMSEVSITKSLIPIIESFKLKPNNLTNRNVSYLLNSLEYFLKPFIYLDEIIGTLQVNSSILVGNFELNVISRQFYEEEICENKMGIRLRVLPVPNSGRSSPETTSTTLTSTTLATTLISTTNTSSYTTIRSTTSSISTASFETSLSIRSSINLISTESSEASTSTKYSTSSISTASSETSTSTKYSTSSISTASSETSTSTKYSTSSISTASSEASTSTKYSTSSISTASFETSLSITSSINLISAESSEASTSTKYSTSSISTASSETSTSTKYSTSSISSASSEASTSTKYSTSSISTASSEASTSTKYSTSSISTASFETSFSITSSMNLISTASSEASTSTSTTSKITTNFITSPEESTDTKVTILAGSSLSSQASPFKVSSTKTFFPSTKMSTSAQNLPSASQKIKLNLLFILLAIIISI